MNAEEMERGRIKGKKVLRGLLTECFPVVGYPEVMNSYKAAFDY
jgi:hypothetical protein